MVYHLRKFFGSLLDETIFGKKILQPIYELLYSLSLVGMNCGNAANFKINGELIVLRYVREKLKLNLRMTEGGGGGVNLTSNSIIIFDVGAHIGEYSFFVNRLFKQLNTQLYSFEPSKKTYSILLKNLSKYSKIRTHNIGFSNIQQMMKLFDNNAISFGQNSLYNRDMRYLSIDVSTYEMVTMDTIDNFCNKNNISDIDFLKIDVEGNELNVLNGAKKMIESGRIRFIQFEFGATNIDSRTYFKDFFYLLNNKYRIFRIVKDGLYPISKYRPEFEIFATSNYLAELI